MLFAFAASRLVLGSIAWTCAPALEISAEPELEHALEEELARLALREPGEARCGVISVEAERRANRFGVRITDALGRIVEREADTIKMIAAIIESAMLSEVTAPLLPAQVIGGRPPVPEDRTTVTERRPTETQPPGTRVAISALGLAGNQSDYWIGAAIAVSFRLARIYLGPSLRLMTLAHDASIRPSDTTTLDRGLDLRAAAMLDAELPFDFDAMSAWVGASAGIAVASASYQRQIPTDEIWWEPRANLRAGTVFRPGPFFAVGLELVGELTTTIEATSHQDVTLPEEPSLLMGVSMLLRWEGH